MGVSIVSIARRCGIVLKSYILKMSNNFMIQNCFNWLNYSQIISQSTKKYGTNVSLEWKYVCTFHAFPFPLFNPYITEMESQILSGDTQTLTLHVVKRIIYILRQGFKSPFESFWADEHKCQHPRNHTFLVLFSSFSLGIHMVAERVFWLKMEVKSIELISGPHFLPKHSSCYHVVR